MKPYPASTKIKVVSTEATTPKAPEINATGTVLRSVYNGDTIVLTVDIGGAIYWIPQSNVEIVT